MMPVLPEPEQPGRQARLLTRVARWPDLALLWIAHLLDRALAHPRLLQLAALLLVSGLICNSLWPLLARQPALVPASGPEPATAAHAGDAQALQEALAVVATYNQASISAGLLGRPDLLSPYLALDGPAWAAVEAEYSRRASRGERHDAALIRWGLLHTELAEQQALIETQELWNDLTTVGGELYHSRYHLLTRNTYLLRRSPARDNQWVITTITTTLSTY